MSDLDEYRDIISKLLDKTEDRKISWQPDSTSGFSTTLRESSTSAFHFRLTAAGPTDRRIVFLTMYDSAGHELFKVMSTVLPTSTTEEAMSDKLESLYESARRQALKIDEKIKVVSDLLDRA